MQYLIVRNVTRIRKAPKHYNESIIKGGIKFINRYIICYLQRHGKINNILFYSFKINVN